jgi:hypothetical protein
MEKVPESLVSGNVCQSIDDFYESLKRSKKYYFSIESRKKKGFLGLTTTNEYTVITEKDGIMKITCNSWWKQLEISPYHLVTNRKPKTTTSIQSIPPELWTSSTKTLVLPFPKEFSIFRPTHFNPPSNLTSTNQKSSPLHTPYPPSIHSKYSYTLYTLFTSSFSH